MFALILKNLEGKMLLVVGPFNSEDGARRFYDHVAGPAYHYHEIISLMSPEEYQEKQ